MDELEFRRNAMIQPNDQQPDFLETADASQANRHYLDEMKQFDRTLKRAMQVDVPAGLAERILLKQAMLQDTPDDYIHPLNSAKTFASDRTPSPWRQIAMAASVAFLLGMSTRWISLPEAAPTASSLAQVAMAHVYEEAPFIQGTDERVNLHSINSKMEKYGATLSEMNGLNVTYANHCSFYQGPALHMVIQGKMGPITLFLVPKHVPLTLQQASFEDGTLKGEIVQLKGANMVLIGEMKESLEPVATALQSRLHWAI
ncbi:DUF3379 domain-containing protein [Aeromonas sobria]|uniref:DUF3379 domain-containing protein n=1 Tax=Aeromonas sobria TaxID=646 RepID=A0A1S2D704_AERSO|nr:DUF3379 domain-containing protein [Aeromonas sobria]MBS4685743.1 DUF3379 domain-containing protein [Aeromonas sobria]OHY96760.1 hypothetical protein BJD16_00430 [Aeromonas sobria]